jgi:hypothetical protein
MAKPEDCRAKAEECRRLASKAFSPLDQEVWLKLAVDLLVLIRKPVQSASDRFDAMEGYLWTGQTKSERQH